MAAYNQDQLGNRRTDGKAWDVYWGPEYMSTWYTKTAAIRRAIELSKGKPGAFTVWATKSGKRTARVAKVEAGLVG